MNAGQRERRRNPQTGHLVTVYNAREAGLCDEAGPWATVCEAHGSICNHRTRKLARYHMADPLGWCGGCREERAEAASVASTPGMV